jgi:hypothetical protein
VVIRFATASVSCGAISCMSARRLAIVTNSAPPAGRSATRAWISSGEQELAAKVVRAPGADPTDRRIERIPPEEIEFASNAQHEISQQGIERLAAML